MALRSPLVRVPGRPGYSELPAGDTINPVWMGSAPLSVQVVALGGFVRMACAVTSTSSGTLKAGTPIVLGVSGLPVGMFLVGGSVATDGVVTMLLSSTASVSVSSATTLAVTAVQPR